MLGRATASAATPTQPRQHGDGRRSRRAPVAVCLVAAASIASSTTAFHVPTVPAGGASRPAFHAATFRPSRSGIRAERPQQSASAFAPGTSSASDKKGSDSLAEPLMPGTTTMDAADLAASLPLDVDYVAPQAQTPEQRLQDEQLHESISATKPQDVLPTLDVLDSVMMEAVAETRSQNIDQPRQSSGDGPGPVIPDYQQSTADEGVGPGNVATLGIDASSTGSQPIVSDDDAVNAVLAAAGEAVAAAEVNLMNTSSETLEIETDDTDGDVVSIPIVTSPLTTQEVAQLDSAKKDVAAAKAHAATATTVTEPVTDKPIEHESTDVMSQAPSVRKILKFAIPAIGVWLCGPLLSLIDTSAVGVLSGTAQQAALNPAVAVTDYAALLIAFMYTGTTNLVAAAQSQDRSVDGKPVTTKTLIGAMQLSTFVGAGLGTILFVFARPLLRAIIGVNDAISPAVFSAAMKYVRIRALGMPAAAVIGSAQAACLGMQDIKSPLYVLAAAAIVNFFGDMVFVGSSHPWIGGAAGAAWATVFSQYAAVVLFARWLTSTAKKRVAPQVQKYPIDDEPPVSPLSTDDSTGGGSVVNLSDAIMEMTGKPASKGKSRRSKLRDDMASFSTNKTSSTRISVRSAPNPLRAKLTQVMRRSNRKSKHQLQQEKAVANKEDTFSVRGFLSGKFSALDLLRPPRKDIVKDFSPYVMPVTSTQFGRVSGYVAMSHVVASSLGTISMAAQQVVVSLFYCLCPIADSLSLTAQSFVPGIAEHKPSRSRAAALRKTIVNFFKAGGLMGAAMVAAVLTIPLVSGFFTSDPAVVTLVNSVVPLLVGFFMTHGWMCASEGLLLGQTDLNFLGKMYAAFCVAVPYLMLRVKSAALSGVQSANLASVWKIFLGYQIFRVVVWVGRVAQLQRKTERQVGGPMPTSAI